MGYQSKTYSLSDEVVAAIEAARAQGLSPNKYLRQLLGIDPERAIASDVTRAAQTRAIEADVAEFDQQRTEIKSRIAQGARRIRPLRQKGDTKR